MGDDRILTPPPGFDDFGAPPVPPRSGPISDTERRRQDLHLFFQLRDKKSEPLVDELFLLYDFQDIALGIFNKYRILPSGWQQDLLALRQNNDPRISAWFNPKQVRYLQETTESYPAVDRAIAFPPRRADESIEKVVDEFVDFERTYFDKLQVFMQSYVSEIEAIGQGKVGPDALAALGLTKEEVEYAFGTNLRNVYDMAQKWLVKLEVLSLVNSAPPKVIGGRAYVLSQLVRQNGPRLVQVYAPYNATYYRSKLILEKAMQKLSSASPKRLKTAAEPSENVMRHLNFDELWKEISQSKGPLRSSTMDSILIKPIQRFPNYKVFFQRMEKETAATESQPEHPAHQIIRDALQKVIECTEQINTEVGQYNQSVSADI